MGVYAVSEYGTGTYGGVTAASFATSLTCTPIEYDKILLSWPPPSGTWDDLALIRSSYGLPTTINDGVELFNVAEADAPTSYLDGDTPPNSLGPLASGRFYYYTLFVYEPGDEVWVPVATCIGLTTTNHAHGAGMWELFPTLYHERDALYGDPGPLERLSGLFGYQVDRLHTELDTLKNIADVDTVSGGLLPPLAASLGVGYEDELGMRISRGLIQNAVHLAKLKGTRPGVEGIASVYTGFGATAVIGPNLLLDYNASGWIEDDVGHWEVTQNATLDTHLPADYTAAVTDTGTLRVIGDGGGDSIVVSGDFTANTLVPVAASTDYVASVYVKHDGVAQTVTPEIVFFDDTGSESAATSGSATANTGSWVRREVTATSPADAAWAAIRITVASPANTEEHLFSAAQLEAETSASTWESARQVNVYLEAQRVNLVGNPSFEVDTVGWAATTNVGIARSVAEAHEGTASLELTSVASGDMTATYSGSIPVTEGDTYTASAFFKPAASARDARVDLVWKDGAVATISTETGTAVSEPTGEFTRADVSGVAPATAETVQVTVTVEGTGAASEVHYVDAVLVEESEFLKPYFDASLYPPADHLWGGTAHDSPSYLYPRQALKDGRLQAILPDYIPAGTTFDTFYAVDAPASTV